MPRSSKTVDVDVVVEDEGGVAAVNRALTLLDAFSREAPALSLAALAERTGLYKSTILRLAESLCAYGYLDRDPQGIFRPGVAHLRLAGVYQANLQPAEIVLPALRTLAQDTLESAAFYVRVADKRLCLYRVASPRAISDTIQQGSLLPLDRGAGGHVLLAFSGRAGSRFERVRTHLLAVSRGERDNETAALACPVFGPDQRLEGALSLSGPITRFAPPAVRRMSAPLLAVARRLTVAFGGDAAVFAAAKVPDGIKHD